MIRAWAIGLLVTASFVPAATRAQASDTSASTAALARELYTEGIEAAEAGQLDEAARAFERSYELAPRAATVINLAAVQERANRLVAALGSYRRFLATADPRLLEARGDAARAAIAGLERRVAHLTITVRGLEPGDEVRLDEDVLDPASLGLELPVDPGEHTLGVRRPSDEVGGTPDLLQCGTTTVTLTEGLHRDEELAVRCPIPERALMPPPPAEDPTPWIALGIGGGVLVIGGVVLTAVLVTTAPQPEPPFVGNLGAGAFLVR